ncbi:MAG: NADH-quinone oxidoreductase subunit D [Acidobacteria bacterium]|nr:MAG: NADH-quinone oxidoreductase subunit D [Acidobacteriota bacterium]
MFKSEIIELNMGPQHPSTHGVLRLKLKLDGETIVDLDPEIGYLHRGVEKLAENFTYLQALNLTDRLDYVAAVSNNLGYIETLEKLGGVEVPRKAKYFRTLMTELGRLSSHLLWLATHALDIGAMTVFLYAFREREFILDMFEMVTGGRLLTTTFRYGGLKEDIPEGFERLVRDFIKIFPDRMADYEALLTKNRIWMKRTKQVGVISAEDAISLGLSGPVVRGSGVRFDVRKAEPYEAYGELDWDMAVQDGCDTYARYLVRLEEMRQSLRIVEQALDGMPEGEFRAKVPKVLKLPKGEVYHTIEAPKGELGYYLISDGKGTGPYRLKVRGPSFVNLQGLKPMVKGHMVADVVAVIGTLDVVLGEVDR